MRLFRHADARGDGFEAAVRLALRAVLVSPSFLYLLERDRTDVEGPYRVSDHELACRLSYFLWSSMPDEELSDLADAGRLHEPEVLELQVRRMLADPRSRALAEDFAGQWLRVGSLAELAEPDKRLFPEYTPELRDAMVEEAVAFFHAILREDRPVLDLLDSDYTYLNERLAKHYGIEGVTGPEFRRVELKDRNRGGVLGMAAVLTLTSYPRRTSPVLRGKWVLEELLGHAPAAAAGDGQGAAGRRPGPRRPDLPPAARAAPQGRQLRLVPRPARPARLRARELRRPRPLARPRSSGEPVDASGKLTTGEEFAGPGGAEDDPGRSRSASCSSATWSSGCSPTPCGGAWNTTTRRRSSRSWRSWRRTTIAGTALVVAVVESFPFQYRRNGTIGGPAMSLKNRPITRRTVLRGVGAMVGLPLLEAMRPRRGALAAAAATADDRPPVRMACLFWPNGCNPHTWTPRARARTSSSRRSSSRWPGTRTTSSS